MKPLFWSVLLQWSRFGINAVVFLVTARFLSLEEFGAFATAFGAIKLMQGLHKAGISETVVIKKASALRLGALFALGCLSGFILAATYLTFAIILGFDRSFLYMAVVPVFLGVSATSDGLLRKQLNMRALALRTLFSQIVAATVTFVALTLDAGAAALILFTTLNSFLSATLSVMLARWLPTRPPTVWQIRLTLKTVLQIAGRDGLNSGIYPLIQIIIGMFIGLPAAGAFQIATRVMSMLDALTLAPLRYLALPKFAAHKTGPVFEAEIQRSLKLSAICACWVWFGLAASTNEVLTLIVGAEHAVAVTPVLQALIPLGLGAALTMTFTQALMAKGATKLIVTRAVLTFGLSLLLTLFLFGFEPTPTHLAMALSTANLTVLVWFLREVSLKLPFPLLGYSSFLPPIFVGSAMFLLIHQSNFSLSGQIATGTLIYLLGLVISYTKVRSRLQV